MIAGYQDEVGGLFVLSVSTFYLDNRDQTVTNPKIVYYNRHHDSTRFCSLLHYSKQAMNFNSFWKINESSSSHLRSCEWTSPENTAKFAVVQCKTPEYFRVTKDTETLQKLILINNSSAMVLM